MDESKRAFVEREADAERRGECGAGRRGRVRVALVVAFVCPEPQRLGNLLGFPLAVIAATSDPARHAARWSATWQGAWTSRDADEWFVAFDEGDAGPLDVAYRQFAFDGRWLGGAVLPRGVTLRDGCLAVDPPRSSSPADLSAVMRLGLTDLSVERVARRPEYVRRRFASNRPTRVAPRYALAVPGDVTRLVPVDDLVRFHPGDLAKGAQILAMAVDSLALATLVPPKVQSVADRGVHYD